MAAKLTTTADTRRTQDQSGDAALVDAARAALGLLEHVLRRTGRESRIWYSDECQQWRVILFHEHKDTVIGWDKDLTLAVALACRDALVALAGDGAAEAANRDSGTYGRSRQNSEGI